MESDFQSFRREARADIQLTQGLLRSTVRRLERQEAILRQQADLCQAMMIHQLEGIQDFRKMEQAVERLGNTLDSGLKKLEDRLDAA